MTWIPRPVVELIDAALVTELTVIRPDGRPITYPLIPMWDAASGRSMTSSILFSRKLEHLKADGRVSLSFSDPIALGGRPARATIQGDATVIDGDPHTDWERVLPLWSAKEPVILQFLKARVAFPLFFERSVIEVRAAAGVVLAGRGHDASAAAGHQRAAGGRGAGGLRWTFAPESQPSRAARACAGSPTFPFALLTWAGEDGYPISAAVDVSVDRRGRHGRIRAAGRLRRAPGVELSLTGSHIRPQPGIGYDERRHVTVWGTAEPLRGREAALQRQCRLGLGRICDPLPRVRRAPGRPVTALLRAAVVGDRPSHSAAAVGRLADAPRDAPAIPVGDLHAGPHRHRRRRRCRAGSICPAAILTLIGAAAAHLGLNVANDVFDAQPGRRRPERQPDPIQRRLARHPVRAAVAPPDGGHLGR